MRCARWFPIVLCVFLFTAGALARARQSAPQAPQQPQQPPQAPAPASPPSTPPPAAAPTTEVKLIDPGKEPRRALRYAPKVGQKQTMSMTIRTASEQELMGSKMPAVKMPPLRTSIETEVLEVLAAGAGAGAVGSAGGAAAAGDIKYRFTITEAEVLDEPGVNPRTLEMLRQQNQLLAGLTGVGVISNRGVPREVKLDLPANPSPQLVRLAADIQRAMGESGTALPEEPVGLGARWSITSSAEQQGIRLSQTATYQLASVDAGLMKLDVELTQSAPRQKIAMPGGAASRNPIELVELTGSGKGQLTVNPSHMLPQAASLAIETTMRMEAMINELPQQIVAKMRVETTIESREP